MRKYWDVLGADQTERGIWVREIDIHYRKSKLAILRLGCESVKQLKHFEKKNVMTTLWEPCDNRPDVQVVVRPVDTAKAAVIGGQMNITTICCDKF